MVSALNSALSGFQAAATQLEAHAQNIANQSSTKSVIDGKVVDKPYVPQQVDTVSLSAGGVKALTRDANPSATTLFNPGDPAAKADGTVQMPNVDVASELVQQKIDANNAQADITTMKVQDNMTQSLLNIIS